MIRQSQSGAAETAKRALAARAIRTIHLKAARDGTDQLTMREIDVEVAAARRATAKHLRRTRRL